MLALKALAAGREVIVSRGQLVEIGGSFRLPEIFEVSGADPPRGRHDQQDPAGGLRARDRPETAAILRVHRSNFRIVGFTEDAELADLVRLAHQNGSVDDRRHRLGSDRAGRPPQAGDEPTAAAAIAAGADLVLFSGDKLLGGPQCGIMAGTTRRRSAGSKPTP